MSQWQIFKGKTSGGHDLAMPDQFDDGIWAAPGEDGFTTDHVIAEVKKRKADAYGYIGRSTQVVERTEADIAPRVEAIAAEIAGKLAESVLSEIISKIPEGGERNKEEVDAEVAAEVSKREDEVKSAAREIALREMGLAG